MRTRFARKDATRARSSRSASLGLEALESRSLLAGLLHQPDLHYLGAFNVPRAANGESTYEYGGTALAYNPARNSLFMVGHDWEQAVGELAIPPLKTGQVGILETARTLQPLTSILPAIPENYLDIDEGVKIGGLMVVGDELVGTAFEYYDSDVDAMASHFKLSSLGLRSSEISGLYQVGTQGGGMVGGYMAAVPAQWREALGAPYLTGQAALSILGRTSSGPAAFGFDPARLGPTVTPARPLVQYPLAHPLAPIESQNPLFNMTTEIRGVVFPDGTDSVLFVGSHGVGPYWYGEWYDEGSDIYRQDKGPHAPEYVYQVWAYDVHDLIAVKNGLLQPWQLQPYDTWQLDLPYFEGGKHIGGVAYDSASGRLYLSQQFANANYPIVHGFQLDVGVPNRNDAPVLNTGLTPLLTRIAEDAKDPAGTQVASLLAGAVSDADFGALRGIAVSAASSFHGTWQYSLNSGSTWQPMGAVSQFAARLVPAWAHVRFLPKADFNGAVKLYYRAWDQTQGTAGGTFNVDANRGGATAFSIEMECATLTVVPVNDKPAVVLSGTIGYARNQNPVVLAANAGVFDVDSSNFSGGRLRVRITTGDSSANRLSTANGFTVDSSLNVLYNGTVIGRRAANGIGVNDLIVTFNRNATRSIVQQLVRSITFRTIGGGAGKRTVLFSLSDGDGGYSIEAMKVVNVT